MAKHKFELARFFKHVIALQIDILHRLKKPLNEDYSDEKIINYFQDVDGSTIANSAISKKVADYMQLLDGEENIRDFTLEDVEQIYLLLIKIHLYDISLYEALAGFYNHVFDDTNKAKVILNEGINKIEKEIMRIRNRNSKV